MEMSDIMTRVYAFVYLGICFLMLVSCILIIVAHAFLYHKAGRPAWAAIVPFYSGYTLFELAWDGGMYFIVLVLQVIAFLVSVMTYNKSSIFVSLIMLALGVVFLVIRINLCIKLADVFGRGGGFAIGLLLLYPIFISILAFGKSKFGHSVMKQPNGFENTE